MIDLDDPETLLAIDAQAKNLSALDDGPRLERAAQPTLRRFSTPTSWFSELARSSQTIAAVCDQAGGS